MAAYNSELAETTRLSLLVLDPLIGQHGIPLTPESDHFAEWMTVTPGGEEELPEDGSAGNYVRVSRETPVRGLSVLAELSALNEFLLTMEFRGPYGIPTTIGHVALLQVAASDAGGATTNAALDARYRFFNTGYADVTLRVRDMPDPDIRDYVTRTWGRLADRTIIRLPEPGATPEPIQIGPEQVRAFAAYVTKLTERPREDNGNEG